jgi:hypothetical protein
VSELGIRLPQWWNDRIDAAWQRSRHAAISDWNVRGDHATSVDASIVEHALAFGHGARSAYSSCLAWNTVSARLRADWIGLGCVGPASWRSVVAIIRHEWSRAAGPGGDAEPARWR